MFRSIGAKTAGLFLTLFLIFPATTILPSAAEASEIAFAVPNPSLNQLRNDDWVDLQAVIPGLEVELKYAGADNITGQRIYSFSRAFLRVGPTLKLINASAEAQQLGYRIKVWDAYRPPEAQFDLWNACPNPNYVANPYTTFSVHSRGAALDVTLTDINGNELSMPSQYDDASFQSSRNYADDPPEQAAHAQILEQIMNDNGFTGLQTEWWHFQDNTYLYPVANLNMPRLIYLAHNGQKVQTAAFVIDGRTLVPVRVWASLLAVNVVWDSDSQQVLLRGNETMVAIKPNSNLAVINGNQTIFQPIPRLIGSTTYIPLRILSNTFAHDVVWHESSQTVTIE